MHRMLKPALVSLAAICCLVMLSFFSIQKMVDISQVQLQDEKVFFNGELFSGTVVERFPNGVIYRKTNYLDGKKHGTALEFGFTGALRAKEQYVDGKKEGLQRIWFLEGPLKIESYFTGGLLNGRQVERYISGEVFREQTFAMGVEVSNKIFYLTKEVYSNYVKKDGRKFGVDGGPLCFAPDKQEGEK